MPRSGKFGGQKSILCSIRRGHHNCLGKLRFYSKCFARDMEKATFVARATATGLKEIAQSLCIIARRGPRVPKKTSVHTNKQVFPDLLVLTSSTEWRNITCLPCCNLVRLNENRTGAAPWGPAMKASVKEKTKKGSVYRHSSCSKLSCAGIMEKIASFSLCTALLAQKIVAHSRCH